jgi:hypothetical protein
MADLRRRKGKVRLRHLPDSIVTGSDRAVLRRQGKQGGTAREGPVPRPECPLMASCAWLLTARIFPLIAPFGLSLRNQCAITLR